MRVTGRSRTGTDEAPSTSRITWARPAELFCDQLKTIRSLPCSPDTSATRLGTGPGRSSIRATLGQWRARNSLPSSSKSRTGRSSMAGRVASVNTCSTTSSTSVTSSGNSRCSIGWEDSSVPSRGTRIRRNELGTIASGGTTTTGLSVCSRRWRVVWLTGRRPPGAARAPMTAASTSGAPSAASSADSTGPSSNRNGTSLPAANNSSASADSSPFRRTWTASTSHPVNWPILRAASSTGRAAASSSTARTTVIVVSFGSVRGSGQRRRRVTRTVSVLHRRCAQGAAPRR